MLLFKYIKSSYEFVADLIRVAKEDDVKLKAAREQQRLDTKLKREREEAERNRIQANREANSKFVSHMQSAFDEVRNNRSYKDLALEAISDSESEKLTSVLQHHYAYVKKSLDKESLKVLQYIDDCTLGYGGCYITVKECSKRFKYDSDKSRRILNSLAAQGFVYKGKCKHKNIYISKVFPLNYLYAKGYDFVVYNND